MAGGSGYVLSKVIKGTVHQMYECFLDVLLHLERMLGIVFMVQRRQIWPKNEKNVFLQNVLKGPRGTHQRTRGHSSKDVGCILLKHIFSFFGHI